MDTGILIASLPDLAQGAVLTLVLTATCLVLATFFAVPLAFARRGPWPVAYGLATYSFVFRGTPLLVQLFLLYYGLPQFESVRTSMLWPILREPLWCAIIAITLNACAYMMELFAGAIAAVPKGEIEAAKALGLSRWQRTRLIVIPRAGRIVLPSWGNEIILILKATALASTVTLMELTGTARIIVSRTYAPYETFLMAAFLYLLIAMAISACIAALARKGDLGR
jgi:His/Glu/Gln/Arg/opine family amino acid ABC transporter permease subunit